MRQKGVGDSACSGAHPWLRYSYLFMMSCVAKRLAYEADHHNSVACRKLQ